jgi:hypothetical protein
LRYTNTNQPWYFSLWIERIFDGSWLFGCVSQIVVRNEESHSHHRSSLDASYGKHWDEVNNKRKLHLSQSFKNQTSQNHTSYTMEVSRPVSHGRRE